MSTLHLVNKAHPASNALASCLAHCRSGDSVLLIEDGVYGAVAAVWPADALPGVSLFVIADDVEARGLMARLHPDFQAVDYHGFVSLAASHQPIVTWF
jgi:tRNA 2-thiouridine synthesizing protein B